VGKVSEAVKKKEAGKMRSWEDEEKREDGEEIRFSESNLLQMRAFLLFLRMLHCFFILIKPHFRSWDSS
jgi:hypothetical protein